MFIMYIYVDAFNSIIGCLIADSLTRFDVDTFNIVSQLEHSSAIWNKIPFESGNNHKV